MDTNQYDWVDFYKEFSHLLLAYKSNRQELIDKVKSIYSDIGINLPTLEKDNQIVDTDPFTVFGLFNKSSMKETNRLKIISAVAEKFGVRTAIPTSFDSIPVSVSAFTLPDQKLSADYFKQSLYHLAKFGELGQFLPSLLIHVERSVDFNHKGLNSFIFEIIFVRHN